MPRYLVVVILILLLASTLFGYRRPVLADTDDDVAHEVEAESDTIEEDEILKPGKFKGYSRHGYRAIQLCKSMEKDGRSARFYKFVFPFIRKYEGCEACEPFYRLIASPCKPKGEAPVSKKRKTPTPYPEDFETPTPTPSPSPIWKQRDPSPEVIERVSFMFNEIASEASIAAQTRIALDQLIDFFKHDSSMTPAERDYFSTVFQAMRDPFNTGPGKPEDTPTPTQREINRSLDDVFNR